MLFIGVSLLLLLKLSWGFRLIGHGTFINSIRSISGRNDSNESPSLNPRNRSIGLWMQHQRPVQRVAIIGAGITGLSVAHALQNNYIKVDIFDSRTYFDEKSGSGIQLTGGLVALNEISPKLCQQVVDSSLPLERVVSWCRPWFGSNTNSDKVERGWKLLELDIQEAIRNFSQKNLGERTNIGSSDHTLMMNDGEVAAYTILRGTLQRILNDQLLLEHGVEVQFRHALTGISHSDLADGIWCQFGDGKSAGPYDLVIGCDGINSAVKQFVDAGVIKPIETPRVGSARISKSSTIYSGIRITFAIQDEESQDRSTTGAQFSQYFGNGAYALSSSYGAGKGVTAKGAFLIYADKNYFGPLKRNRGHVTTFKESEENSDWTQDNRVPREHISECLEILKSASIPGNSVAEVVEASTRFFDLGVYFHNPFSPNGWVREVPNVVSKDASYCVVAGDAAHAMPPFLGQGANQAIQDAYVLASKVHQYNRHVQRAQSEYNINDMKHGMELKTLLKEYESKRWFHTTSITTKAVFLGYLETSSGLFANFRDAFFLVMGKIGVAEKVFLESANPNI